MVAVLARALLQPGHRPGLSQLRIALPGGPSGCTQLLLKRKGPCKKDSCAALEGGQRRLSLLGNLPLHEDA